jgi:NO-binding membrane sensor protein with MHYT domain
MITSDQFLAGPLNRGLVALSFAIEIVAAYAALGLPGRTTSAGGKVRFFRLSGRGSITEGRIWSIHHVSILAFRFLIYALQEWPTNRSPSVRIVTAVSESWRQSPLKEGGSKHQLECPA